jgi:hypothetical protein
MRHSHDRQFLRVLSHRHRAEEGEGLELLSFPEKQMSEFEPPEPDEFTDLIQRLGRATNECADPLHAPILSALPPLIKLLNDVDDGVTAHLAKASPSRFDAPSACTDSDHARALHDAAVVLRWLGGQLADHLEVIGATTSERLDALSEDRRERRAIELRKAGLAS